MSFSPRFARHLFVDIINSGHPRTIQAHFLRNASVTSQLLISDGSPQTIRPEFSAEPIFQNPIISTQSCSSSHSSPAWIMLSRILGRGKKSNQGWCGMVFWTRVGRKLSGMLSSTSLAFLGASVLKWEIESSSILSKQPPAMRRLFPNARKTLTLVRVKR